MSGTPGKRTWMAWLESRGWVECPGGWFDRTMLPTSPRNAIVFEIAAHRAEVRRLMADTLSRCLAAGRSGEVSADSAFHAAKLFEIDQGPPEDALEIAK